MSDPTDVNPSASRDASFSVPWTVRLRFTHDALASDNPILPSVIEPPGSGPARVIAAIDEGVLAGHPKISQRLGAWADHHGDRVVLVGEPLVIPGGEACKNDREAFDRVVAAIDEGGLCRHSCVLAIGGGAVLDVVGFAAACAHRGVRLVRMPSTTLAQADGGVGVKNGLNVRGKKNFIGTFSPPWAIVNDLDLLATLDDRDWRCGLSEIVKVSLLKDAAFFEDLEGSAEAIVRRDPDTAFPAIRRSAHLHLAHITEGGDPFESTSARPLDFGHWAAHALEQVTGWRLRHGEAVAIGIAIDTAYAALIGRLPDDDARRILDLLSALGFTLSDEALGDAGQLLEGLEEFRQHLGGELTITLLERIGHPWEAHRIDTVAMTHAIERVVATPG